MEGMDYTINIDHKISAIEQWVSQVNTELENPTPSTLRKRSIYKVPSSSNNAYKPLKVSIGPYHHREDQLKGMEEHKHRAFIHFLMRSGKPLKSYVDALVPMVENLKYEYDQLDDYWKDNPEAFLALMIVDGCFILELLRTTTAKPEDLKQMGYEDDDPIFSEGAKLFIVPSYLKHDMLILDNQIPMLVLTTLLAVSKDDMTRPSSAHKEVIELILKFFCKPSHNHGDCLHILDVYRKSLLLIDPDKQRHGITQKSNSVGDKGKGQIQDAYIIRSATELNEAGIKIMPSETRSLKDISFVEDVLKLPVVVVDDTLESQYLNLMAFEHFHVGAGNEVTSYVFFMDNLIDSSKDVSLLHSSGIIHNALGSHKAIADFFNSSWTISKGIRLDSSTSLDEVYEKISEHCEKPWPKWKASLRHNYFSNPWAAISVIAAIVLFALTSIQTVYTVLSYNSFK